MDNSRYESNWVQTDRTIRGGLWGCYDTKKMEYVALGPKGKMNEIAKLLNEYGR